MEIRIGGWRRTRMEIKKHFFIEMEMRIWEWRRRRWRWRRIVR